MVRTVTEFVLWMILRWGMAFNFSQNPEEIIVPYRRLTRPISTSQQPGKVLPKKCSMQCHKLDTENKIISQRYTLKWILKYHMGTDTLKNGNSEKPEQ